MKKAWCIILFAGWFLSGIAQQTLTGQLLDSLSRQAVPALNKKLSFSVSGLSLKEFIRAFSHDAGLNVVIPNDLNAMISNNFQDVRAADILTYLCKEYNLKIAADGNIFSLSGKPLPLPVREMIAVKCDRPTGMIHADLKGEPLQEVVKALSTETGVNISAVHEVKDRPITCYIQSASLSDVLELICKTAGLKSEQLNKTVYLITSKVDIPAESGKQLPVKQLSDITVDSITGISVQVKDGNMDDIFRYIMHYSGCTYRLLAKLEGTVDMEIRNASVEEFLYRFFKGTRYTYCFREGVCYAGERGKAELKGSRLLPLYHRSVIGLLDQLPKPLLHELDVKEFEQLNSLLVYGTGDQMEDFTRLVKKIDQTVPVILIDVLIVDISDRAEREIGLEYGVGGEAIARSGGVSSGVSLQIGKSTFDRLLKEVGWGELIKVPDDFYLKLKAMEEHGYVNIRSTPRLSTINGNEARMSIGRREYYKEERQDYFGTQDPQLSKQTLYKEVEAELSVMIRPVVAGDGSVNLNIKVEQSNFTERLSSEGPPGKTTRKFESIIRVMDRETILLGGLEEELDKRTTTGVPWLSRIPVLKLLFGNNQKAKTKSRLNILIKPTVIN